MSYMPLPIFSLDKVSLCIPRWLGIHYVAQAVLEFIAMPLLPGRWDYGCLRSPPHTLLQFNLDEPVFRDMALDVSVVSPVPRDMN